MTKTDIFVCVLIYLGVNSDLQGQTLVKDKPKIANLPQNPENQTLGPFIVCWDILMILYGDIWWELMYKYPFWPVLGLKLVCPQNPENSTLVTLTMTSKISNAYLWSYMMETNKPICVLIHVWVYNVFWANHGQKNAKNSLFSSKFVIPNSLPRYCAATSSTSIDDHIWSKVVCQHVL